MKCQRCKSNSRERRAMYHYNGQDLCEICYVGLLNAEAAQTAEEICDPFGDAVDREYAEHKDGTA